MTRDELIETMTRAHYAKYFEVVSDMEPALFRSREPLTRKDRGEKIMRFNCDATTPRESLPDADWHLIPSHMHEDVRRYIIFGDDIDNFLAAVIHNNLVDAVSRADDQNATRIREWAQFLHSSFPYGSWGSEEARRRWQNKGGLHGRYSARTDQ